MADESRGVNVNALNLYLQETRAEIRKVVWPSREDAVNLTIVVLVVTIAMTAILSGMDWVFSVILNYVLSVFGA